MAANEDTNYTNFSNVEIGTANGGGGLKVGGLQRDSGVVVVPDAATYTVTLANNGKTHVVPNLTASCTLSLPTATDGIEYKFIYGGVAADVQNFILDTGADANFYLGGLVHLDTDAGAAGDEVVPAAGDGNSNSKLTVVTPDVGTEINLVCDGTNWYLSGQAVSAAIPTFADQ